MVNISYRVARAQGYVLRSAYRAALPWIVKYSISQSKKVSVRVYSFSGNRDLPEQVASIVSFIRYVGIPERFTVVSDGSHSPADCQLLRQINSCIDVVSLDSLVRQDLPQCVYAYASHHPLGKKLSVLMSIPINQVTVYADSDILFFPGAEKLIDFFKSDESLPQYLPDCSLALDQRLIYSDRENLNPVNSGFMILKKPLDWEIPLERFSQLKEVANYFTEQTIVHLTMHFNQALPLRSDRFIVRLDDQFIYRDRYAHKKNTLRHYVSPVRHKFWFRIPI